MSNTGGEFTPPKGVFPPETPNEMVEKMVRDSNRAVIGGCLIPLSIACGLGIYFAINADKVAEFLKAHLGQ